MIDLFVESVPTVGAGFRAVESRHLLALHATRRGSDRFISLRIARRLLERGIDPAGHFDMAGHPAFVRGSRRPARPARSVGPA